MFLRLLFRLLNGRIEPTKYEDECRTLLGANSYVLFTLDKLIYKVVKQAQSVLNDSTAAKLLQLHSYEARAPATLCLLPFCCVCRRVDEVCLAGGAAGAVPRQRVPCQCLRAAAR